MNKNIFKRIILSVAAFCIFSSAVSVPESFAHYNHHKYNSSSGRYDSSSIYGDSSSSRYGDSSSGIYDNSDIYNNSNSILPDEKVQNILLPAPAKCVILGDSISTGYGLDGYKINPKTVSSYANLMFSDYEEQISQFDLETQAREYTDSEYYFKKRELPALSAELENYAKNGQTSLQLKNDLLNGKYDECLKNCDLMVISIGGNDLLDVLTDILGKVKEFENAESFTSAMETAGEILSEVSLVSDNLYDAQKDFEDNLSEIASYIDTHKSPDSLVVIQTLYNPFEQFSIFSSFQSMTEERVKSVNKAIYDNQYNANAQMIYEIADVYTDFNGKSKEYTNIDDFDIHPNAEGHSEIYKVVEQVVSQYEFSVPVTLHRYTPPETSSQIEETAADTTDPNLHPKNRMPIKLVFALALGVVILAAFISVSLILWYFYQSHVKAKQAASEENIRKLKKDVKKARIINLGEGITNFARRKGNKSRNKK